MAYEIEESGVNNGIEESGVNKRSELRRWNFSTGQQKEQIEEVRGWIKDKVGNNEDLKRVKDMTRQEIEEVVQMLLNQ